MSNLEAIRLILLLFLASNFVTVYMATHLHFRSDALTTGVLRGVTISLKERRMILFQEWLPLISVIAGLDLILALGFAEIAAAVDETIAMLAWLACGVAGFAAVFIAVQGIIFFSSWLSVLRDSDAS